MTIFHWCTNCYQEEDNPLGVGPVCLLAFATNRCLIVEADDSPAGSRRRSAASDAGDSTRSDRPLTGIRPEMVYAIRGQIERDGFDIDARLAGVIDRILDDLMG